MEKIDFIITWVDGNDPKWRAEKNKYQGKTGGDSRDSRYREWDTLRYWFRGVEKYAPWVNRVFFVTWGHVPEWLNLDCEKLRIVRHDEYIPHEYLPTFSSRTIDMNFHRIPDLSEHFVYFNDDMFLISPTEPKDFFRNGMPVDTAILNAVTISAKGRNNEPLSPNAFYTPSIFNTAIINKHFDKKEAMAKNFWKWHSLKYGKNQIRTLLLSPWKDFTGFENQHLPYPYLKETYREVWEKEPEMLSQASKHRFRVNTDVNHFVFTYWQLAKGEFEPRSKKFGKCFHITDDESQIKDICRAIEEHQYKTICLNDEYDGDNQIGIFNELRKAFERDLGSVSFFEK